MQKSRENQLGEARNSNTPTDALVQLQLSVPQEQVQTPYSKVSVPLSQSPLHLHKAPKLTRPDTSPAGQLSRQHTKRGQKGIQSKLSLCLFSLGLIRSSLGASPSMDLRAKWNSAWPCSQDCCTVDLYTHAHSTAGA